MPYAIVSHDKPGAHALRASLKPAHLDYLVARQHLLLAGGAILDDQGRAIGALVVVDTDDAREAKAFIAEDPFTTGGLFESSQVMPWRQAFFDRRRTR